MRIISLSSRMYYTHNDVVQKDDFTSLKPSTMYILYIYIFMYINVCMVLTGRISRVTGFRLIAYNTITQTLGSRRNREFPENEIITRSTVYAVVPSLKTKWQLYIIILQVYRYTQMNPFIMSKMTLLGEFGWYYRYHIVSNEIISSLLLLLLLSL